MDSSGVKNGAGFQDVYGGCGEQEMQESRRVRISLPAFLSVLAQDLFWDAKIAPI